MTFTMSDSHHHLVFSENDYLTVSQSSVHPCLRPQECPGAQTQILDQIVVFVYTIICLNENTFVIADIEMLIREIIFFRAYNIIYDSTIHFFSGSEVHIMVFSIFTFAARYQAKGIYFDKIRLRKGIAVN